MRHKGFSEAALQQLANQLSYMYWNCSCQIPVIWNGKLSRTMGRFIYETKRKNKVPIKIEMSKRMMEHLDFETFKRVLLHELCHYHMFIQDKPFKDHHPEFEKELKRVDAISTNTLKVPRKAYQIICSKCNQNLGIRIRLNQKKFLSGCCRAKIIKKETWL